MNLTPEELEKGTRVFLENEQKRKIIAEKEENYRRRAANNQWQLNLRWTDKIEDVDLDFINERITIDAGVNFREQYNVICLDLNRVVNFVCDGEESANEEYLKKKLWEDENLDLKILTLVEYIESGKVLCPPLIEVVTLENQTNILSVCDGNHRIRLCRSLGLVSIPFIVKRNDEDTIRGMI